MSIQATHLKLLKVLIRPASCLCPWSCSSSQSPESQSPTWWSSWASAEHTSIISFILAVTSFSILSAKRRACNKETELGSQWAKIRYCNTHKTPFLCSEKPLSIDCTLFIVLALFNKTISKKKSSKTYIINSLPVVGLFSWHDGIATKEIIVLRSSHSQVLDKLYCMTSLLISVAPEQISNIRKVYIVLETLKG